MLTLESLLCCYILLVRVEHSWPEIIALLISDAIKNQLVEPIIDSFLAWKLGSSWPKRADVSNIMKIFQHFEALDQWEPSLNNPDQWECSTLVLVSMEALRQWVNSFSSHSWQLLCHGLLSPTKLRPFVFSGRAENEKIIIQAGSQYR